MKKQRIVLSASFSLLLLFLVYVQQTYGWHSSISKYSKYLTLDNSIWMFVGFIAVITLTMIIVTKKAIPTIGGCMLLMITTFTGYNEHLELFSTKGENVMHVVCTNIGIVAIFGEMFRVGLKKRKIEPYFSILSFTLIGLFILFAILFIVCNVRNHTYWIEIAVIVIAYFYYFIFPTEKTNKMKTKKLIQDSAKVAKTSYKATEKYVKQYPKAFISKTPKWQRRLRNLGIVIAAMGTGIATAPVSLPAGIAAAGTYMIWGGGVITAVCQGFKESK